MGKVTAQYLNRGPERASGFGNHCFSPLNTLFCGSPALATAKAHCLGTSAVPSLWPQGSDGSARANPTCSDPGLLKCHLSDSFGSK